MDSPLTDAHHNLIKFLVEKAFDEAMKNPNGHLATETPPFPEELHDHPKPIEHLPDGRIRILIK